MMVLIIGYPDSGKSELAENMVMEMSAPGERIYLATMIPYGKEGQERIARHRKMREGKGFVTIEAPFDISGAVEAFFTDSTDADLTDTSHSGTDAGLTDTSHHAKLSETEIQNKLLSSTVLLECLSNLVANEMFERHTDQDDTANRIISDVMRLKESVRDLVIVSNHFEIAETFDEDTIRYIDAMDMINDRLSKIADRTIRL